MPQRRCAAANRSLRQAASLRRREMVIVIQTSAAIVIHRPIGEVFRFAADLSNIALWVR